MTTTQLIRYALAHVAGLDPDEHARHYPSGRPRTITPRSAGERTPVAPPPGYGPVAAHREPGDERDDDEQGDEHTAAQRRGATRTAR